MHQRVNIIGTDQFNARLFQLNHPLSLPFSLLFLCIWVLHVMLRSRIHSRELDKNWERKVSFRLPRLYARTHRKLCVSYGRIQWFRLSMIRNSKGSTQVAARIVIHSKSSNYYKTNKNLFSNVEMSWPFSFRINNLSTNLETLSVKIT